MIPVLSRKALVIGHWGEWYNMSSPDWLSTCPSGWPQAFSLPPKGGKAVVSPGAHWFIGSLRQSQASLANAHRQTRFIKTAGPPNRAKYPKVLPLCFERPTSQKFNEAGCRHFHTIRLQLHCFRHGSQYSVPSASYSMPLALLNFRTVCSPVCPTPGGVA
jgi:hypothetical protein